MSSQLSAKSQLFDNLITKLPLNKKIQADNKRRRIIQLWLLKVIYKDIRRKYCNMSSKCKVFKGFFYDPPPTKTFHDISKWERDETYPLEHLQTFLK